MCVVQYRIAIGIILDQDKYYNEAGHLHPFLNGNIKALVSHELTTSFSAFLVAIFKLEW
jgi:hypothetical protein